MCSNICQCILKLSFGDVNYFHGCLVDWCHEEIWKPANVKGGMCGSFLIRNGYSLALIKNKSFSTLNCWFLVLMELLKDFQCLHVPLWRIRLWSAAILCVHILIWFSADAFGLSCVLGRSAGRLASQNTSGFGNALGITGMSET